MPKELRIALVHDELIRRGGAEIVFEQILKLYPNSDVYALYAGNDPRITVNGKTYPIKTSFIQRLPVWCRKRPGRVLPLLPYAAEQFDLSSYDLVITSASGFAKGIITRSTIPHLCYCHTPTRYLWDASHEVLRRRSKIVRPALKILQHYLRMADFAAAQRPDIMVANSRYTQRRIASYYRRPSEIVYPPIDTSFFSPKPAERLNASQAPFLFVGRLTPEKNIDHAIAVCEKLKLPLVIVGTGSHRRALKKIAGRYTTFVGRVSRHELRNYYRRARALLQPGREDFGMASVEALSCGTPVIALGQGGAVEVISSSKLGVLYREARPELLAEAIRRFLDKERDFNISDLQRRAMDFSTNLFARSLTGQVDKLLAQYQAGIKLDKD